MPKITLALCIITVCFTTADVSGTTSTAQGLRAWEQVYSVLIHPRCINCHTASNYPQQGDDRRRHVGQHVPQEEAAAAGDTNSLLRWWW